MSNIINIGGTSGGSGSSVVPNPQGTATDTLTKLGIEGTIYDFAGGGGGSYIDTDTVIQAQTAIPANTDITYTATQDCAVVYYINIAANSMGVVSVDGVSVDGGWRTTLTGLRGCVFLTTGQTITLRQTYTTENGFYIVYGVLGGSSSGSGHNYSTTEQVVGTWIDGSTLYEKTIVYSGNIGHGSYATIDNSLSYSGVDFFTVVTASAKLATVSTWFTYSVGGQNYDVALSDANGVYVENFSSTYDISDVVVTIRYTKSTT